MLIDNKCNQCKLKGMNYARGRFIANAYPEDVLFIGDYPNETESITGVPFTGSSGNMLYGLMKNADIDKAQVNITNVVKCYPPKGRRPTNDEIECCFPLLKQDILNIQPKLIVAIGDISMTALTGISGIMRNRGNTYALLDKYEYQCHVLTVLHPSFVMRSRNWINTTVNDLKKIFDILSNNGVMSSDEYFFINNPHDISEIMKYLNVNDTVSFDTETTGLDWFSDKIIGISFSNNNDSAMVCELKINDERLPVILTWLADGNKRKCTQNGMFDIIMILSNYGVRVNGIIHDTRLAESLLNSVDISGFGLPTNLDFLRSRYTNMDQYKPTDKSAYSKISKWSPEVRMNYACKDAICTRKIMTEQIKLMSKSQVKFMHEIISPMINIFSSMTYNGIIIDKNKVAMLYHELDEILSANEKELTSITGCNINYAKAIKETLNIKDISNDGLMHEINRRHKSSNELSALRHYRSLKYFTRTYLIEMYSRLKMHNNKMYVHPSYKFDSTEPWRISSINPNLSNIHNQGKYLFESDPGTSFICYKYTNLKMYIVASLSKSEKLFNDLNHNKDIYTETRKEINEYFNKIGYVKLDIDDMTRDIAYESILGHGDRHFAIKYNISLNTANKFRSSIIETYNLNKFTDIVRDKKNIINPFGRIMNVKTLFQGMYFLIESTFYDIISSIAVNLYRKGFNIKLISDDDIIVQINDGQNDGQIPIENQIDAINMKVPYCIYKGKNWGSIYDG